MNPDRFRLFTKRGASVGVLTVVAATLGIVAAAAALGALMLLAF